MQDNVAAEGVIALADGEWYTKDFMVKSSKYNWTVDANNVWGNILTVNFWVRGGVHQFEVSPNGKWIHIAVVSGRGNFIYVLQPGDVLKRPDGTDVDFTPGEDMLRVSYSEFTPGAPVTYQYLVRRIAYLDQGGKLVKTRRFEELQEIARQSTCWNELCQLHSAPLYRHIEMTQALTYPVADRPLTASSPQQVAMN